MRRAIALTALIVSGGLFIAGSARSEARGEAMLGGAVQRPRPPQIQKVKDNLYVIPGFEPATPDFNGANTWAFVTTAGVVLIDTKNPGMGQIILDQLKTVTDKPVTKIINTHAHADHTGSNGFFDAAVETVVQAQTKANMEKMPSSTGGRARVLPGRTFTDTMSLLSGKDRIDLHYFGPAHTNGDAFVVFPALRAMATGDAFGRKAAPLIDTDMGGSPLRYHETLAKTAATIKDVDLILTGHASGVLKWQDLLDYAEFTRVFFEETQRAFKTGKSADEAAAGLTLPTKFKDYSMVRSKDNVRKIYAALQE